VSTRAFSVHLHESEDQQCGEAMGYAAMAALSEPQGVAA
jgi:hypothetical protein